MSCLTGVWQDNRHPARASRLVKCDASVGSIEPPPSFTTHLHCAHEPPPPQAEARNKFCPDSVFNNLSPAGTVMVFSPLISMCTSPLFTKRERANKIIVTKAKTMAVNMPTPKNTSMLMAYKLTPLND